MRFKQLVDFVKRDGCMVRLYKRDELKVSQCSGTFDVSRSGNPVISIAIDGHTELELKKLLLHEYAHFLQWKDGTLHIIEGPRLREGWHFLDEWLRGRNRTKEEVKYGTMAALYIEYDAEIRTIELSRQLNVDIGSHKEYIRDSNSYILLIKWSAFTRTWGDRPDDRRISNKILSFDELFAELTNKEIKILEDVME